jgi:signal transduction histidine kinase
MLNKPFLYFLAKMIAVITLILVNFAKVDLTFLVISTLSFSCVFVLELLFDWVFHKQKLIIITILLSVTVCFFLGIEECYPLYLILIVHLFDLLILSKMFYYILGVTVLLSFFLFTPTIEIAAYSLSIVAFVIFIRILLDRLLACQQMNELHKETISELNGKMVDLKSLTKTLKYTVSMEERNRIAARIHDQIGHGISGSIIMLEAAMLVRKNNPDKADESIQKAISNLREGVDEIRAALKEERASRDTLGMNDVTSILEEFKVGYNKSVSVNTTGDLDCIPIDIWSCIHDNLKECLTNVLKHSNATEFRLNIEVFKKVIKVEYKDNGKSDECFEKGLGLEAIEERTVNTKGRCFFNKGERGFCVTNIFTY